MHHRQAMISLQTTKPKQLIHDDTREEKIPFRGKTR